MEPDTAQGGTPNHEQDGRVGAHQWWSGPDPGHPSPPPTWMSPGGFAGNPDPDTRGRPVETQENSIWIRDKQKESRGPFPTRKLQHILKQYTRDSAQDRGAILTKEWTEVPRQHPKDNASKEIAGIDNKHYSGVTRAQAQDRRPVVVLNDDGKKIGGDAYTDNGDYNEVKVNQFKSTKCGQRLCMQINEDKIKIGCQAFAIKEKSAERGVCE